MTVIDYNFTTISFTIDYRQLHPDKSSEIVGKKILQANKTSKTNNKEQ